MADNLTEAWEWVVDQLESVGLRAVTDPRNLTPPCVLVEPPTITAVQSQSLVELEFPISVVAPPPGNRDSVMWLLRATDLAIEAVTVTGGAPGSYTVGATELPAYNLTATVQIRRT